MISSQFAKRFKEQIFKKPKCSNFRCFLQEKWMEHKNELMIWEKRFPEYDDKYYFNKHKWMLKRMYREEVGSSK